MTGHGSELVPDLIAHPLPDTVPLVERLPAPPRSLGRLGSALHRLAAMQGAWPPTRPLRPHTVDLRPVEASTSPAAALALGYAAADTDADAGVDLLVIGCAGDPAPALLLIATVLDLEPVAVVGMDPSPGWAPLVASIRDGLNRTRHLDNQPVPLLVAVGDPQVAYLAALVAAAAVRRTPMVIDATPTVLAAALVADRLASGARDWMIAGCSGTSPASRLVLSALELAPLLDLELGVQGGAQLAGDLLMAGIALPTGPAPDESVDRAGG